MKKRVLLVNKFYYSRGGAEVVAINLRDMLTAAGYEVAVFTMDYKSTLRAEYVHTAPEVTFKEGGIGNKIKFARRTLGGYGVQAAFEQVLKDFNPHIVHLHNIHSYISPVVASLAKKHGCRVVWTLHDYKLACPAYSCLNRGKVCEKCYTAKWEILVEQCFKDSFAASALAWLEAVKWNKSRLERCVDVFICPSEFMRSRMIKAGINPAKLVTICNFIDPVKAQELAGMPVDEKEDYYVYVGRLSVEKGVDTLLAAASNLPYKLKIAGGGPLKDFLKERYSAPHVEFVGKLDAVGVTQLLKGARLLVQPSECYENNPLSTIEALCAGVPVVGANIGGIPELINDTNGKVYTSGNREELKRAITDVMERTSVDYNLIAKTSRERFSAQVHLEKLEKVYSNQ